MSFPEDPDQELIFSHQSNEPVDFNTPDFDYSGLNQVDGEMIEAGARLLAGRLLRDVLHWITDTDNKKSAYIRSRLVWWILDPKQKNVKLNELAANLHVKKQSISRLHTEFRTKFHCAGPSTKSDAAIRAFKRIQKLKKLTNL